MGMIKFMGKKIQLYPNDSQTKICKVIDVHDEGIVVRMLEIGKVNYTSRLKVGDEMFYNWEGLTFKLLKQ